MLCATAKAEVDKIAQIYHLVAAAVSLKIFKNA
jgi:hypothetical protein